LSASHSGKGWNGVVTEDRRSSLRTVIQVAATLSVNSAQYTCFTVNKSDTGLLVRIPPAEGARVSEADLGKSAWVELAEGPVPYRGKIVRVLADGGVTAVALSLWVG